MYPLSVKQLNFWVGCDFGCGYCESSFQGQLKRWGKKHCSLCYQYKPHAHFERMKQNLPKTRYMQFIFLDASGDIASCPDHLLQEQVEFVKEHPDRTFLTQSKNPITFNRVKWPDNVILGTTIETHNAFLTRELSRAPDPIQRYVALKNIEHPLKMVVIEPILRFNPHTMIRWIEEINPCMIWLGYDSKPKQNKLKEPPLEQVKELHWELAQRGFVVILKTIRKAWWEK